MKIYIYYSLSLFFVLNGHAQIINEGFHSAGDQNVYWNSLHATRYLDISNTTITGYKNYSGDIVSIINTKVLENAVVHITASQSAVISTNFIAQEGCVFTIMGNQVNLETNGLKFDEDSLISSGGLLYQNTPNPFSVDTEIRYFIPENSENAWLEINDMNGSLINRIKITEKGYGTVRLHASELKSKIIIYGLYIDNTKVESRRMIINK